MKSLLPVKFLYCSAILSVLASPSLGYELPGDAPVDDNRFALSSLKLDLSQNPVESSIVRRGDGAATMQYKLEGVKGFSLSSSYSSKMENPFDRFSEFNTDGFWDLRLRTPRSGAIPAVKIDYSFGGFDGDSGDEFGAVDHRMLKVNSKGKLGMFEHGVSFKSIGAEYDSLGKKKKVKDIDKGKDTIESWIGSSYGDLSLSQFTRQTQRDDGERKELLIGTRAEYTLLYYPYIGTSFSHATGTLENDADKSGDDEFQLGITAVSASLSMSHDYWSADLYMDRTTVDESADQSYGQPDLTTYYFGGSVYPNDSVTVTPSVSITEEDYREYAALTRATSVALDLSYQPQQKNYAITAYASNDTLKNPDWGMDTTYFYAETGIKWDLSERDGVRNILSFTVGYERYEDHIYSSASMADVSVKVSFKSYSLDSILHSHGRSRRNNSPNAYIGNNLAEFDAAAVMP